MQVTEVEPYALESLVAEILRDLGWIAEVTPKSGDDGRDILATKFVPGADNITLAVEVKQWDPKKRKFGKNHLSGPINANRNATKIWVVAPGGFTKPAIEKARADEYKHRLDLKDGEALIQMISKYSQRKKAKQFRS